MKKPKQLCLTTLMSNVLSFSSYACCQWFWCTRVGQDPAAPSPTEAATNTKHTSDLLRRFKELTVKEPKDLSGLDQPEVDLRVRAFSTKLHSALQAAPSTPKLCVASDLAMPIMHTCVASRYIMISVLPMSMLSVLN